MRFDWYQATTFEEPDPVLAGLLGHFDLSSMSPTRAKNRYANGMQITRGHEKLCEVWWGGNLGTHVLATGQRAPSVSEFMRSKFPEHQVSRADAAEDYSEPGAFERLYGTVSSFALAQGLKTSHEGDWLTGEAGRSFYIGSRKSEVYGILYEKGKQLGKDPNHVRMELRVMPHKKDRKELVSKLTPSHCWALVPWSSSLAMLLGNLEIQRIKFEAATDTDDVRSFNWMLRQYGPLLTRMSEDLGDWASLGVKIESELKRIQKETLVYKSKPKPLVSPIC